MLSMSVRTSMTIGLIVGLSTGSGALALPIPAETQQVKAKSHRAKVGSAKGVKSKRTRASGAAGGRSRLLAQSDLDLERDLEAELDMDTGADASSDNLPEAQSLDTEPVPAPTKAADSVPLGEDVQISDIRYDSRSGGGTVMISTTGVATYRTREIPSQNQVVIEVANAKLPDSLKRPFNTKDFKQAIVSVNAYQDQGSSTARIVLQFRQPRSVDVRQDGGMLKVVPLAAQNLAATPPEPVSAAAATNEFETEKSGGDAEEEIESYEAGGVAANKAAQYEEPVRPAARSRGSGRILPTSTLQQERDGDVHYYGKPISIEVRDTPVRDVISLISEQSGANIILSDDVQGNITIKLRQIPWDQALAIIMKTRGLGYVRQNAVLRIAPIRQLQAEAEEARRILEAQEATLPLTVRVIPVSFANVTNLVIQIRNTLQSSSSTTVASRGRIEADARSSSLIVTDTEENVGRIEQLVKALDTAPLQVMIEGKIVEAREDSSREIGINWGYTGQDLGFAGGTLSHNGRVAPQINASNTTLSLNLGTLDFFGDLDAKLSLLERELKAKIISSPRVVTMNAQEARIEQAISIALPSTVTPPTGSPITTTTFQKIPTTLTVTPQITAGGDVIMKVAFKREFQFGASGANASIESRDVQTNVMVKNGQTSVIGGMYQVDQTEQEQGTPFLRKIPVLGWLFKSRQNTNTRNELLVFLTPRILNADRTLPKAGTVQ